MQQYLDSYARGARKLFENERQLSIAIDGSGIAKKALLLIAMAKPTGEAAWTPPQVSDDYIGECTLELLDGGNDTLDSAQQALLI